MFAMDDRIHEQNDPSQQQEDPQMKRKIAFSLSAASLALALFAAAYLRAETGPGKTSTDDSTKTTTEAQRQAERMVPAQVILKSGLDALKLHTGDSFQATLVRKVKMVNGPELPQNTVLKGTVTINQARNSGSSQLILRFTEAKLNDGRSLPVKAMITGLLRAGYSDSGIILLGPEGFTEVDQPNAIKGVDLHSAIDDANSGAFISADAGKLKLAEGSKLGLALAFQGNS
jgi:hypothetical protein